MPLVEIIWNSPYNEYFKLSLAVEQELASYMDEKFYPTLFDHVERVFKKKTQREGIDMIASSSKQGLDNISIDEKGACQHIDKSLNTFACELLYFKNHQKKVGWLVDANKRNDHYLFMWPRANQFELHHIEGKEYKFFKKENITKVEYALVKKNNLIEHLNDIGWSYVSLYDEVQKILDNKDFTREVRGEVEFTRSNHYPESPINILIKKETLKRIATIKGEC